MPVEIPELANAYQLAPSLAFRMNYEVKQVEIWKYEQISPEFFGHWVLSLTFRNASDCDKFLLRVQPNMEDLWIALSYFWKDLEERDNGSTSKT